MVLNLLDTHFEKKVRLYIWKTEDSRVNSTVWKRCFMLLSMGAKRWITLDELAGINWVTLWGNNDWQVIVKAVLHHRRGPGVKTYWLK